MTGSPGKRGSDDGFSNHEQITHIRGELLDLVGVFGASAGRFDRRASLIQDDLIMVTIRLGRIADQLDEERTLVGAQSS